MRQFRSFTHMAQPQRKPDHTLATRGARGADQVSAEGAERLTEGPQQVRTHAVGQVMVLEVAGPLSDVIEESDRAIQLALADGPPDRRPPRGSPSRPSIAIAAAHVNVDLAYTTFGGVRLVIATDDLRGARAAPGRAARRITSSASVAGSSADHGELNGSSSQLGGAQGQHPLLPHSAGPTRAPPRADRYPVRSFADGPATNRPTTGRTRRPPPWTKPPAHQTAWLLVKLQERPTRTFLALRGWAWRWRAGPVTEGLVALG